MAKTAPIIDDVLGFWFGAEPHEPRSFWFMRDDSIDAEIHARFGTWYKEASVGDWDHLTATAQGTLALIIILDQFPRNMFRDDARSFETDALALALAKHAVNQGFDQQVSQTQRVFFYLPYEHSESMADQETCLELCKPLSPMTYDYAVQHHAIIQRFGRFPHRNKVLGRISTPEEVEYLKDGNPFG